MIPVLSVAEMQAVDAAAGVSVDTLMDRAGFAVAIEVARMGATYGDTVHVLCGSGNNGGDGYVAATYLRGRGVDARVHAFGTPAIDTAAARARHRALSAGVPVAPITTTPPEPGFLVVDAVFGTGFHGMLPDEVATWATSAAPVLAVDIPSGVHGDTGDVGGPAFGAERTVTFHAPKPGHILGSGPDLCGEVIVVDIGLDGGAPAMFRFTDDDVAVPGRRRIAHKWSVGAVATIGGMPGLTGAALLAARAALRSGAGVSSILTTAATVATYEALAPELTTMQASETDSWRDHASEVLALLGRYDVLVVGPGLEPAPSQFVERLLEGFDGPMVVDAGAIGAITRLDTLLEREAPTVLTPHAGEFHRLTGVEASHEEARRLADATGTIVLLKGNPTFVAGRDLVVVDAGGPELASIGTGDVLAGVIAALLAGGIEPGLAAAMGAHIHARAAARLAGSTIVTASDLVDAVGVAVSSGIGEPIR